MYLAAFNGIYFALYIALDYKSEHRPVTCVQHVTEQYADLMALSVNALHI